MSIYIIGDTHGDYTHIRQFCKVMNTTKDDIMIILGNAGLNYYGGNADHTRKQEIVRIPITQFLIHGNHEMRPETIDSYYTESWHNGQIWKEKIFLNSYLLETEISLNSTKNKYLSLAGI